MRKKNQHGISLKEINSFEIYPEIVFKEIFDYYGGKIRLPGHGEYKFNGKHIVSSLVSKQLSASFGLSPGVEITSNVYLHATKYYGNKTKDYFYYEYWKLCQKFLILSQEFEKEMLSTSNNNFIRSYAIAKKFKKLIDKINEFHEDERLVAKIMAWKV